MRKSLVSGLFVAVSTLGLLAGSGYTEVNGLAALSNGGGRGVAAQTVIDLSDVEVCDECRLPLEEVIRLGASDGPGMIEEDWTRAAWHGDLGYLLFAGPKLRLFGSDGSFAR